MTEKEFSKSRAIKSVLRYLSVIPVELSYASRVTTARDCAYEEAKMLTSMAHTQKDIRVLTYIKKYLANVKYKDLREDLCNAMD
jgi:hypothetical protein